MVKVIKFCDRQTNQKQYVSLGDITKLSLGDITKQRAEINIKLTVRTHNLVQGQCHTIYTITVIIKTSAIWSNNCNKRNSFFIKVKRNTSYIMCKVGIFLLRTTMAQIAIQHHESNKSIFFQRHKNLWKKMSQ